MALQRSEVSCRVYHEYGDYPDGWAQGVKVTSAETEDKVRAVAKKRLRFDGRKFQALFGSYEPTSGYLMFRLTSRKDMKVSEYTRAWRSQVCSGKY